mmetsp:Transcript_99913/g.311278  ORF Transcript_99913/g.311278 Transcript_99913/m.311278 type:complete len:187 (+) Transcript_99913:99-659(+)|eukprot:CAMPEP_0204582556 /NCGR_PEP_ID=MMETSP0661-20131031/45286_1 /ASSEMBLY_ACC=CAM_ASM_000606 /TAXON_ID=109239 /ORGANISM="Alexandrium margalefi, Strain AMGDE01CS-322" /LENGTH=186 /DNA_ID=CAMNT_0051591849 /DNA_START=66 /DNA_END=626 /DNA_ORIENTATION=+
MAIRSVFFVALASLALAEPQRSASLPAWEVTKQPDAQCKSLSYGFCCELGTPCDCAKGTTASGQCKPESYAFCCSVGTPCDCSKPPLAPEFPVGTAPYFNMSAVPEKGAQTQNCAKPGDCGLGYEACCAAYGAKGFPCGCELKEGAGEAGSACGHCGLAYAACCAGFQAKGFPCTCDVEPPAAVFL